MAFTVQQTHPRSSACSSSSSSTAVAERAASSCRPVVTCNRGDLPGDYAYDPLELSREQAKLDRFFEYELLHARWAMLGALGALVPGGTA
jgi:hypothetical protein